VVKQIRVAKAPVSLHIQNQHTAEATLIVFSCIESAGCGRIVADSDL